MNVYGSNNLRHPHPHTHINYHTPSGSTRYNLRLVNKKSIVPSIHLCSNVNFYFIFIILGVLHDFF